MSTATWLPLPPDDLAHVVAANVRQAMREQGLVGVEMARRLKMPQSTWSRRETGRTPLTVDELWEVAAILRREPGTFFGTPQPVGSPPAGARSSTDRASDYGSVVRPTRWVPRRLAQMSDAA